ncbi:hypothetical protein [Chitinasiproducens palmae]|nr:hypothetical protein [Chitinasiproducens palmae]
MAIRTTSIVGANASNHHRFGLAGAEMALISYTLGNSNSCASGVTSKAPAGVSNTLTTGTSTALTVGLTNAISVAGASSATAG